MDSDTPACNISFLFLGESERVDVGIAAGSGGRVAEESEFIAGEVFGVENHMERLSNGLPGTPFVGAVGECGGIGGKVALHAQIHLAPFQRDALFLLETVGHGQEQLAPIFYHFYGARFGAESSQAGMIAVVEMTGVDAYAACALRTESALCERIAGVENIVDHFACAQPHPPLAVGERPECVVGIVVPLSCDAKRGMRKVIADSESSALAAVGKWISHHG